MNVGKLLNYINFMCTFSYLFFFIIFNYLNYIIYFKFIAYLIVFALIVTVGFVFELGKNALSIESKQNKAILQSSVA